MPWYKVFCDHGGGHQSHSEYYHWEDKKLTKDDRRQIWEEAFNDLTWPIGDVILVSKLPLDYYNKMLSGVQEKIKTFKEEKIKEYNKLLTRVVILKETEVGNCRHSNWRSDKDLIVRCPDCNATRAYGKKWRKKKSCLTKKKSKK